MKLFGNRIEKSCSHCVYGRPSSDGTMIECKKRGMVDRSYACFRYQYDPLKRIPHKTPFLPKVTKDDFQL